LLTIQQYALSQLRRGKIDDVELKEIYEKLVVRSLFGNTNASRNSA
jgi:phosphoenolpyruvate carboxylase